MSIFHAHTPAFKDKRGNIIILRPCKNLRLSGNPKMEFTYLELKVLIHKGNGLTTLAAQFTTQKIFANLSSAFLLVQNTVPSISSSFSSRLMHLLEISSLRKNF